jgi:hypothetical protein
MRPNRWVGVAVMVAGCQVGAPVPDDGGQSGTAVPPHCVEDARIAVDDLSVAPDGMSFPASEALAAVEGTWEGQGELQGDGGGLATVDATVAWDGGEVDAVFQHLDGDLDQGQGALGAPASPEMCDPVYEIGFDLDVVAGEILSAAGSARVQVGSALAVDLPVQVDQSEVGGTLQPPDWDHPEYWDRTVVSADFQHWTEGTTALNLDWFAINDDPAGGTGTATTGNGGTVGTGWVEPSGQNSPILYLQGLIRVQ